jgi:hypothetical protein
MLKKTAILILIGIVHFALSFGIVPIAMIIASGSAGALQGPSTIFRLLVIITKLLHFIRG